MDWIRRFFTSRYVKSAVRYLLVVLVAYLIQIPLLSDLAEFLHQHADRLVDIIAALIIALIGSWSVSKNKANAKIEEHLKVSVK